MMCPACGGVHSVPEAGGYRCTSQRLIGQIPAGFNGNVSPATQPIYRQCGYFYTYAEGHASLQTQMGVAAARRESEAEAVARRDRVRAENAEMWNLDRPRLIAAALVHSDDMERLLLCARHWVGAPDPFPEQDGIEKYDVVANFAHTHMTRRLGPPEVVAERNAPMHPAEGPLDPSLWGAVFPQLWAGVTEPIAFSANPPWDSKAAASWFAARAKLRDIRPDFGYRSNPRFIGRTRTLYAFRFAGTTYPPNYQGTRPRPELVLVAADGRYVDRTSGPISVFGLKKMATMLGLHDPNLDPSGYEAGTARSTVR